MVLACLVGVAAADPVEIHGKLFDRATHEPLVGATLITPLPGGNVDAQISNETGDFAVEVPAAATVTITIYYADVTIEHVVAIPSCVTDVDLGTMELDIPLQEPCCVCDFGPPPMIDVDTALSSIVSTTTPLRTRDVTSLMPLAASAPSRRATWLDGERRIGPGVALGLLDEVAIYTTRGAPELDQASDGVALATKTGSNENRGAARIALDRDGSALEAGAGGPIVKDSAWWWAGAVLGPSGAQQLAKINVVATPEEQGDVVALHQTVALVPPPGAVAFATQATDDWGAAKWLAKFDDNKLQITGGASGERLDEGIVTTRGAIDAHVVERAKVFGYHELRASGELGAGTAGVVEHRDASASAGDVWTLLPNMTIDAGVRWDERWFGTARAEVWQPHATIGYDWSKEGRSQAFVSADRASLLDVGAIGGWLGAPRFRDDVIAGAAYEVIDDWLTTVAVRSSGGRTGVDGALDHRGWLELHVTASSIERAVAGYASVRHCAFRAGLDGRWAPAGDLYGSQAGALASWHHDMARGMSTDIGIEALTDRVGEVARVVIGFSY